MPGRILTKALPALRLPFSCHMAQIIALPGLLAWKVDRDTVPMSGGSTLMVAPLAMEKVMDSPGNSSTSLGVS